MKPGWGLALGVLLGALLAAQIQSWRYSAQAEEMKRGWAEERTALAQRASAAESKARETETTRQQTIDKVRHEAAEQIAANQQSAAQAANSQRRALERMQRRADELATTLGRERAAHSAATSGSSPAEESTCGVFTELLGRSSERIRQLAATADDARTRGLACERSYDALTQ